jgi:hypothetical protein
MNLKALITALVLAGTSTAALADPVVRDHRAADASAQVVRGHRDQDDLHRRPSWMVIASQGQLAHGRDVIATNARISSVKLVALKGSTTINTITIKFANGATQKLRVNQTIAPDAKPLTFAINGGLRNVTRITVTGSSSRRASFQLLGA